jgi:hypothetical protein
MPESPVHFMYMTAHKYTGDSFYLSWNPSSPPLLMTVTRSVGKSSAQLLANRLRRKCTNIFLLPIYILIQWNLFTDDINLPVNI